MKRLSFVACWTLAGLLLSSCQSTPYQKIEIGAEKGRVLHLLGNPHHTYRKNGTDRWVYNIKDANGAPVAKEVWFQDGRVVYQDTEKNLVPTTPAPAKGRYQPIE